MSQAVEELLRDAGIEFEDTTMAEKGADAILQGRPLSLELNDEGDLKIDSDDLDTENGGNPKNMYDVFVEDIEVKVENDEVAIFEEVVEDSDEIDPNFRRCGLCGQLKHKKSLQRHVKLVHASTKVVCDTCGLQLTSEEKLEAHTKKVHGLVEEIECTFCDQKFRGKALASYHETTAHKQLVENMFHCDVCGKSYKTKPNLSRHKREKHKDWNVPNPIQMIWSCFQIVERRIAVSFMELRLDQCRQFQQVQYIYWRFAIGITYQSLTGCIRKIGVEGDAILINEK